MQLSYLDFEYTVKDKKLKDKKFSSIFYNFDAVSDAESKEEFIDLAKSSIQRLEQLLDNQYNNKRFTKEKNGRVTSSKIKFKCEYLNSSIINYIREGGLNKTELSYIISMDPKGEPINLTLSLNNSEPNSARILRVYDSIITLPDLKISEEAQIQVNRINSLRSEKFEINKYLNSHNSD